MPFQSPFRFHLVGGGILAGMAARAASERREGLSLMKKFLMLNAAALLS